MTPVRTASQIAQLITALCKAGTNLPKSWSAADLISLIKSYSKLIATITANDMRDGMVEDAKQSKAAQLRRDGRGYETAQGLDK